MKKPQSTGWKAASAFALPRDPGRRFTCPLWPPREQAWASFQAVGASHRLCGAQHRPTCSGAWRRCAASPAAAPPDGARLLLARAGVETVVLEKHADMLQAHSASFVGFGASLRYPSAKVSVTFQDKREQEGSLLARARRL